MRKREISSRSSLDPNFFNNWAVWITALSSIVLGSGSLLQDGRLTLKGMIAAVMLTIAAGHFAWRMHRHPPGGKNLAAELEGPFLLVVIAWALFRFGESLLPNLIIIPALTIAWLTLRYSGLIVVTCVLVGVVIEGELTLTGTHTPLLAATNLIFCGLVAAVLHVFPGSKSYKAGRRQTRTATGRANSAREQAAAMGLAADPVSAPEILPDLDNLETGHSFSQQTIETVNQSFELQLEMIRLALDLTTLAVLWPDPANAELRLRYLATTRKDIDPGPYPVGTGITGALAGNREETELVGVKPSHPALPYYRKPAGVGAILALRIPLGQTGDPDSKTGILCADRETDRPWTEGERQVLRLTGKKLALEINSSRLLLNLDRERATIHRLYQGLRALNSDLQLDSIFATSIKAVKALVPTDLLALCLREDEQHRIVVAEGAGAAKLTTRSFPVAEGLVGQALKTARTLPAGGRYLGAAPIFANDQTFTEYQSILVIPLPDEERPLGCLVAASKTSRVFTRNRQEILEIIAAQIAIKIKLGQTHERLALLATTDGLTGLANHQTFQHGCQIMLERAKRNGDPLCVLMMDLDHFKSINDRFGHPYGDQVLQKVAVVLTETIRTVDLAARYGGEEFAVVLENCDGEGGRLMAERIRKKIAELNLSGAEEPFTVTLSLGMAVFPKNSDDKARLIELADQALYRAKQDGRNRTVLWSDRPA